MPRLAAHPERQIWLQTASACLSCAVDLPQAHRTPCSLLPATPPLGPLLSSLPQLNVCSYVRYSYMGVALNELNGLVLTCTPDQLA